MGGGREGRDLGGPGRRDGAGVVRPEVPAPGPHGGGRPRWRRHGRVGGRPAGRPHALSRDRSWRGGAVRLRGLVPGLPASGPAHGRHVAPRRAALRRRSPVSRHAGGGRLDPGRLHRGRRDRHAARVVALRLLLAAWGWARPPLRLGGDRPHLRARCALASGPSLALGRPASRAAGGDRAQLSGAAGQRGGGRPASRFACGGGRAGGPPRRAAGRGQRHARRGLSQPEVAAGGGAALDGGGPPGARRDRAHPGIGHGHGRRSPLAAAGPTATLGRAGVDSGPLGIRAAREPRLPLRAPAWGRGLAVARRCPAAAGPGRARR